ncbi:hypothetical protein QL285_007679 [Trifolium repens]|nr:hypothetical protein QL285_007679 [Trifolium repens]
MLFSNRIPTLIPSPSLTLTHPSTTKTLSFPDPSNATIFNPIFGHNNPLPINVYQLHFFNRVKLNSLILRPKSPHSRSRQVFPILPKHKYSCLSTKFPTTTM